MRWELKFNSSNGLKVCGACDPAVSVWHYELCTVVCGIWHVQGLALMQQWVPRPYGRTVHAVIYNAGPM
jgi:hypothetical protein